MTLAARSRLGPYEIQAPLGTGGMGEVCRARDTRLERASSNGVRSRGRSVVLGHGGIRLRAGVGRAARVLVDRVEVPVARLQQIIRSKQAAGRDRDRLFLATHREAPVAPVENDELSRARL
jgi:serine/threonine protein kinase